VKKLSRPVLLFAAAILLSHATLARAGQPAYGTDIRVEPAGTGVYMIKAKVMDLADRSVLSAPMLKVAVDEPATSETVLPDGQTRVLMTVKFDSAAHRATCTIEVKKAGSTLASSSTSLPLP
jgi:hypothetical protein